MKRKLFIIALMLTCWLVQKAFAKSWISLGIPTIYRFAEQGNSPFSTNSGLSGTPFGYMLYGSIYDKPFIGYEKYKISLDADNSDEATAIIDVRFYDIGLNFEQRYTHVLIGYGYGSTNISCKTSVCSGYNFEEGIARQVFAQLGVVLFDKLNFHLSAHRVTGQNDISIGSVSDRLVFNGMLYAFGLKLGW